MIVAAALIRTSYSRKLFLTSSSAWNAAAAASRHLSWHANDNCTADEVSDKCQAHVLSRYVIKKPICLSISYSNCNLLCWVELLLWQLISTRCCLCCCHRSKRIGRHDCFRFISLTASNHFFMPPPLSQSLRSDTSRSISSHGRFRLVYLEEKWSYFEW